MKFSWFIKRKDDFFLIIYIYQMFKKRLFKEKKTLILDMREIKKINLVMWQTIKRN